MRVGIQGGAYLEVTNHFLHDLGMLDFAVQQIASELACGRGIGKTDDEPMEFWYLEDLAQEDPEVVGDHTAKTLEFIKTAAQTGLWGDEGECYQKAYKTAQEILDEYWPQIHAIGTRLGAVGRVEGAEIVRLFNETG